MDGAGAVCRLSGRRGRAGGARPRPTRRARLQSRGCGPAIGRWPPRACASGGGAPGAAASAAAGGLGSNGVHPHQSARQRLGIPVSWAAAPDTAGPGRSASIPCGEHRPGHPAANHSRFPADPFNIPSNSGDSGMVSDISTTYGGGGGGAGGGRPPHLFPGKLARWREPSGRSGGPRQREIRGFGGVRSRKRTVSHLGARQAVASTGGA